MNYKYRRIVSALAVLSVCIVSNLSAQKNETKNLSVLFDYNACKGLASNQFAVWIEDAAGSIVKTIFVTDFTAEKGWKKRPEALPEWVAKNRQPESKTDAISSATSKKTSGVFDVVSGATPKSGTLTYVWNFTDAAGNRVPDGIYTVKIEGSLYWEHRVVYSASVSSESTGGSVAVTKQIYPLAVQKGSRTLPERNKNMISNVMIAVQY